MSVEEMTQMEADLRQKQEKAKMKELFEQEMKALNSFIEGIDSLRDNDQEANSQERQKRLQTMTADAEMCRDQLVEAKKKLAQSESRRAGNRGL